MQLKSDENLLTLNLLNQFFLLLLSLETFNADGC